MFRRPTLCRPNSVNQMYRLPSTATSVGPKVRIRLGTSNSLTTPAVGTLATLFDPDSATHSFPSGRETIPRVWLDADRSGYSWIVSAAAWSAAGLNHTDTPYRSVADPRRTTSVHT